MRLRLRNTAFLTFFYYYFLATFYPLDLDPDHWIGVYSTVLLISPFKQLAYKTTMYVGELLVAPSGVVETDTDTRLTHCTYVFSRCDLSR